MKKILILSVFFSVFFSGIAMASPQLPRSDNLFFGYDKDKTDVTDNIFDLIREKRNQYRFRVSQPHDQDQIVNEFWSAIDDNRYAIVLNKHYNKSENKYGYFFTVYYFINSSCKDDGFSIYFSNNKYSIRGNKPECNLYYFSYQPANFSFSYPNKEQIILFNEGFEGIYLFALKFNVLRHSSVSPDIDLSFDPKLWPRFQLEIKPDGFVYAWYLKNLNELDNNTEFEYSLYSATFDFQKQNLIHQKTETYDHPFGHQVPFGSYVLVIKLKKPVDGVYDEVEFEVLVDGNLKYSNQKDFSSGTYKKPKVDCSLEKDMFKRLNCESSQRFNFGVINPMITKIRNLFSNTASDVCLVTSGWNIGNTSLFIDFSDFISHSCKYSKQIRSTIMTQFVIILNSTYAVLIFMMIKQLIRKLLDHKDDNIVEGS